MAVRPLDPRLLTGLGAAAVTLALALAGGGYSDLALGAATVLVWVVLVVGVLAGRLARAEPPPAFVAAACLLTALLAITALSLDWTPSREAAFADAVRLAGYLGAFLLAGLAIAGARRGAALVGVAAVGVAVALLALGSRLLGIGDGDADLVAAIPTAAGRLSYPIGYWNALGALMALTIPPLAWIAARAPQPRARSLAMAAFAPPLLAAYMTSSRGALIAVILGLAVVVGLAPDRRHVAAAVTLGVAAAVPAVAVASVAGGILSSPGDGVGFAELSVLGSLLAGMAAIATVGARVVDRLARSRPFSIRIRLANGLAALAALVAALVALAGPSALIGDLRAPPDDGSGASRVGIVSTSGSGRAQFWETALEAFESQPVRGIGAGGYESYWAQNGSFNTPARNAHSEPLEALAELGPMGFACFVGFLAVVLVVGVRRARRADGGEGAAALGLVAAGLVGFAIDWTWQVPAIAVPLLVAVATLLGAPTASERAPARIHGRSWPRLPAAALGMAVVALAIPVLWSGAVLAIASSRLDASADALARGQLDEAAAAARSAAAVEPWAAEPWLSLAAIEQAGSNFEAARIDVAEAIERSPESLRAWLLVTNVQAQLGNVRPAAAYALRTLELGGLRLDPSGDIGGQPGVGG